MPPIRRSLHATRRAERLRRNNKDNPRIPQIKCSETVDGLVLGWQFKFQYEGSVVPEVGRKLHLNRGLGLMFISSVFPRTKSWLGEAYKSSTSPTDASRSRMCQSFR
jgi:hypothetical protein